MDVCDQSKSFEHLLSKQLLELSELSETITLRLLELEERLNKLQSENLLQVPSAEGDAEGLLAESEEKVRHLQGLLDPHTNENASLKVVSSLSNEGIPTSVEEELAQEVALQEKDSFDLNEPFEDIPQHDSEDNDQQYEETTYVDDPEMPLLSA